MEDTSIRVDNYIIDTPLETIVYDLKQKFPCGKLKDIRKRPDEIVVTCVNSNHANGQEKNPDAHINLNPSKLGVGVYHCFSCGCSCSFPRFVAYYFDSSVDFAKQWLIKNYGKLDTQNMGRIDDFISTPRNTIKTFSNSELVDEISEYQDWCPYLAKRGLSQELCKEFNVKYDQKNRQVVFPVEDVDGKLRLLAKRSIDSKVFFLTKGVEKELYCLNKVKNIKSNFCLITEGPFDCLSGWANGLPTIASLGAISDYQIEQINKSAINVLYLAFDNDNAGKKFSMTVKEKLNPRILTVDIELPGNKKDLNDLSLEDWAKIKNKYFSKKC